MADNIVTGSQSRNPEWTTNLPSSLRGYKQLQQLARSAKGQRGRAVELDLYGEKGGAGLGVKPARTRIDKAQDKTEKMLRAEFQGRKINEASVGDKEFIAKAEYTEQFDATSGSKPSKQITLVEYSPASMLLRVTFSNNGAVVVYGGIPMGVYARLKSAWQNGRSVGATFWDLIRIYERRGLPVGGPYGQGNSNFVREGSKFAFTYEKSGVSQGPRPEEYDRDYYDPFAEEGNRQKRLNASEIRALELQRTKEALRNPALTRDQESYRKTQEFRDKEDIAAGFKVPKGMKKKKVSLLDLSPEALDAIQQAIKDSGKDSLDIRRK